MKTRVNHMVKTLTINIQTFKKDFMLSGKNKSLTKLRLMWGDSLSQRQQAHSA